jgi:hypothetical protein
MKNFQQTLMRTMWKPQKRSGISMVIRGKILNVVQLIDINRTVQCGQEISLDEFEVNRSRDLQNAIKRDWVEVIFDKYKQIENRHGTEDVVGIAKKMAQSMAEEMIKNSPLVKEIAKEVAKEMLSGIQDSLKAHPQQIVIQQVGEKKIDLKDSDNVFVEFKDEEVGMTSNIKEIGKVEIQKDDLTSSLEKMKKFRQNQKG